MKRKSLLGVIGAAALTLVLAACVYDADGIVVPPTGDVPVVTLPAELPADEVVDEERGREWIVDQTENTITIGTDYTYTNVQTRSEDAYNAARESGNTAVIIEFAFDAYNITGFTVIANGHGAEGLGPCTRWDSEARADHVPTFFQGLIDAGTVFGDVTVDAGGGSTYSKRAIVYAANFAATHLGLVGGGDADADDAPPAATEVVEEVEYGWCPENVNWLPGGNCIGCGSCG